jgi:hypothetical protein
MISFCLRFFSDLAAESRVAFHGQKTAIVKAMSNPLY